MEKKSESRPFHETIVDAINAIFEQDMAAILALIKVTVIPENHDAIIEAINNRRKELNLQPAEGVINHLIKQKEVAEKKAAEKKTKHGTNEFIIHSCEQALRFTQVDKWDDLSEERKVQLGFNLGAMALGLDLNKSESFEPLTDVRNGSMSMQKFREHLVLLITSCKVEVDEINIAKPF